MSGMRKQDMTSGPILKLLMSYAVPLLLGDLLQQLYSTVDSIIIGNVVGKEALAAVGATGHLINVLIGVFMGFSIACNIVIAMYFGAHDAEKVSRAVQTTITFSLIVGCILTITGVISAPFLLKLMATPEDVFSSAVSYLRVYFSGILALAFYNMFSGILRAVGDSIHPLIFLGIASAANIGLDLLFVAIFKWGVAGAAAATIISQAISACLSFRLLLTSRESYRIQLKKLMLDKEIARQILKLGLPISIQRAITQFSNVFVQSYINAFGSDAMAGYSIYNRLHQLIMLPNDTLGATITTFVSQNRGARRLDRIKAGVFQGAAASIVICTVLSTALYVFAVPLSSLFSPNRFAVQYGTYLLQFLAPTFILQAIMNPFFGACRGLGDSQGPVVVQLCSFVVFRQIYLRIGFARYSTLAFAVSSYPAGWLLCVLLIIPYYFYRKRKIVTAASTWNGGRR